ncbi:cytochrome c3 family protein [Salidesulfovibrio brasiliensis]
MQKRYLPISIITVVMLIAAVAGYVVPAGSQSPPVKVLLESKGGNVLFTHQQHADMGDMRCGDCHHTSGEDPNPPRCTDCHPAKFSAQYLEEHTELNMSPQQCASCHHPRADISPFDHDLHVDEYTSDCTDCHHDTDIEDEPQQCSNCHEETDSGIPSLMNAAHERCANCHEEDFSDSYRNCGFCHKRLPAPADEVDYTPCADCHSEPVSNSVPSRVAAFHQQCQGCHEKAGTGPYGKDACYQCHIQ